MQDHKKTFVILALTPFHLHQLNVIKGSLGINENNSVIMYGNTVTNQNLELKKYHTIIPVPKLSVSFQDVLLNPFSIWRVRKEIKNTRLFFEKDLKLFLKKSVNLVVFSFHGILPQLLQLELKYKTDQLIEIEEGLAFYYSFNIKDQIMAFLYPIISSLFLGFKCNYRGLTGRNPHVTKVYARFPDLLPKKFNHIEYQKIKNKRDFHANTGGSNKVLIFTSPYSEYRMVDKEIELSTIKEAIRICQKYSKIDIKTHPKESKDKYGTKNKAINFLDSNEVGEEIDFFKYSFIIHFGSSIILDLISANYPSNRIIMIDYAKVRRQFPNIFNKHHLIQFNTDLGSQLDKILKVNNERSNVLY
ncbi:MAG: hypothetical protein JXR07_08555 [Reichenbachiella sp.]